MEEISTSLGKKVKPGKHIKYARMCMSVYMWYKKERL